MKTFQNKRWMTGLLLAVLLAGSLLAGPAASTPHSETDLNWPPMSELKAGAWLAADLNSGDVLLSHEMDTLIFPASTTKIMTALLLLESGRMDESVIVSEYATTLDYDMAKTGFIAGETVMLHDVFYAMMLSSGNDAARIAAEAVAGTEAQFAELMNAKAAELGMASSHFMNASGLSDDNHKTTASDMFRLVQAAMEYEAFRDVVGTRLFSMPPTDLHPWDGWAMMQNSNQFMTYGETALSSPYYRSFTGIKTGTTRASGYCLVLSAESWDDREIILLLFGVSVDEPRAVLYQTASTLLNEAASVASLPLEPAAQPTAAPTPEPETTTEPAPSTTAPDSTEPPATETDEMTENQPAPSAAERTMSGRLWQMVRQEPWRAVSVLLVIALILVIVLYRRAVQRNRKTRPY